MNKIKELINRCKQDADALHMVDLMNMANSASAELEALCKFVEVVEHALESDAINTRCKEGQDIVEALDGLK